MVKAFVQFLVPALWSFCAIKTTGNIYEKLMHYEILDSERKELLPKFARLKDKFYLAGGTALALQLGHRKSQDFDFFTGEKFNEQRLQLQLNDVLAGRPLKVLQQEWQTVEMLAGNIKISFFYLPYPLLQPTVNDENLRLASVVDIGCMKLNAITSRSVSKDFVDLYYICQQVALPLLLKNAGQQMPALNENVVLKSLVYFDELQIEPLEFLPGKEISIEKIKKFFISAVKDYAGKN